MPTTTTGNTQGIDLWKAPKHDRHSIHGASARTRVRLGVNNFMAHERRTLTSFNRPAAPDLITTSALRHWKCSATNSTSSALALPSTGGDFSWARQVPSGSCVSDEIRELGFTLTRRITAHLKEGSTQTFGGAPQRHHWQFIHGVYPLTHVRGIPQ